MEENKLNKLEELMEETGELLGDEYNKNNYGKDELYNRCINDFNLVKISKNKKQTNFLLHLAWQGRAIEKELCKDRFDKDEFNEVLIIKLLENMYDIIVEYMNNPEQD